MPARTWGPFTGRQLTTIIVAGILVVGVPGTAWAIDTFSNVAVEDPVSGVKASVDSAHALLTAAKPKPPASPFFATVGSALASPEVVVGPTSSPINTTSVSASMGINATATNLGEVALLGFAVPSTATDCSSPTSQTPLWSDHHVSTSAPIAAAFPTPLQFRPPSGSKACLVAENPTSFGVTINVSGYLGS